MQQKMLQQKPHWKDSVGARPETEVGRGVTDGRERLRGACGLQLSESEAPCHWHLNRDELTADMIDHTSHSSPVCIR